MSKKTAPAAKRKAPEPKKKTFPDVENDGLRLALEAAGGWPQLAAALNISRQGVHKWKAIPDRLALKVERLYGIPQKVTVPHLFE